MTQRTYRAEGRGPANGSVELRAALTYPGNHEFLNREDVATLVLEVWKLGKSPHKVQTFPLLVDDAIVDGPIYHEQDSAWEYSDPYNFRATVPANTLTDAPARYRMVLKIRLINSLYDEKLFDWETWSAAGHA